MLRKSKYNHLFLLCFFDLFLVLFLAPTSHADERHFTYVYEADVLGEGNAEIEQWVTNQNKKRDGDYSRWDLRTELEYGLTPSLMTALYLNWENVRQEGVTGKENDNSTKFKGISSEWVYQLLNPTLDPIGVAAYGEYSTDGIDHELEAKLLLSKRLDSWELAANFVYEAEFEKEDGETEKEATFEFVAGAAYRLNPHWTLGVESRNKSAYPGGLDLKGQEFQTWSVGPALHYGSSRWWATLTVLPQVWGNGDGAHGGRQLVHEESLETRLLVGFNL